MSERLELTIWAIGSTPHVDNGLALRFDDERQRMGFTDCVDRALVQPILVTTASGDQFFMRPSSVIAYEFGGA